MLLAEWINRARSLWESEVVSKLDQHQQDFDGLVADLPDTYLSKVNDDTAAGVITFTPTPVVTASPPINPAEVTRKDYVDAQDAAQDTANDLKYAILAASNTFTATPQIVRSPSPTGIPEFRIEKSDGTTVLRFYFNEATNNANILTDVGVPLYIQNREPGGALEGPIFGDNNQVTSQGPGTATAEVDFWIKDQTSLQGTRDDLDGLLADAPFARLETDNVFVAPNQSIQAGTGVSRPAWRLRGSDAAVALEMYYNDTTQAAVILAYAGRPLRLQPGAAAGVQVGNPTYVPLLGELSAEGKVYAENEELLRQDNGLTWLPLKGFAAEFNGVPTVAHSYNITAVTSPSAGVYRLEINQTTINGVPLTDMLIPTVEVFAPDAIGESVFARFQPGAPAGFIDVFTFTMTISGQNLFDDAYVLGVNDVVFVNGLLNVQIGSADPLPSAAL